jgi:hypothetical protein
MYWFEKLEPHEKRMSSSWRGKETYPLPWRERIKVRGKW